MLWPPGTIKSIINDFQVLLVLEYQANDPDHFLPMCLKYLSLKLSCPSVTFPSRDGSVQFARSSASMTSGHVHVASLPGSTNSSRYRSSVCATEGLFVPRGGLIKSLSSYARNPARRDICARGNVPKYSGVTSSTEQEAADIFGHPSHHLLPQHQSQQCRTSKPSVALLAEAILNPT